MGREPAPGYWFAATMEEQPHGNHDFPTWNFCIADHYHCFGDDDFDLDVVQATLKEGNGKALFDLIAQFPNTLSFAEADREVLVKNCAGRVAWVSTIPPFSLRLVGTEVLRAIRKGRELLCPEAGIVAWLRFVGKSPESHAPTPL